MLIEIIIWRRFVWLFPVIMNFESRTSASSPVVEEIQISGKMFQPIVSEAYDSSTGGLNNNNNDMPSPNHNNFVHGFMANGFPYHVTSHPNHHLLPNPHAPANVPGSTPSNVLHHQQFQSDPWSTAPMEKSSCQFSFTYSHHHQANMSGMTGRSPGDHHSLLRAKLSGNYPDRPSEVVGAPTCMQRIPMLSVCTERGMTNEIKFLLFYFLFCFINKNKVLLTLKLVITLIVKIWWRNINFFVNTLTIACINGVIKLHSPLNVLILPINVACAYTFITYVQLFIWRFTVVMLLTWLMI